jgi:hypothetical protein
MRQLGLSVALIGLWLAMAPAREVEADAAEPVIVTNFPEVQRVAGEVTVAEPIPQTRFQKLEALVAPASEAETGSWTEAGRLTTAGFGAVTLGLVGTVQGRILAAAPVGVVLLPDVPEVVGNFRSHGITQHALRLEALVSPAGPGVFESAPAHLELGFPSYRVLLYNATPRTSEVTVYAYLKGS